MQSAEEFRDALWQTVTGAGMAEVHGDIKLMRFGMLDQILRRDAEWQSRVEKLEAALKECVEYIQRTDKVNPMEALYRGEGYSRDVLPLINKICSALSRTEGGEVGG